VDDVVTLAPVRAPSVCVAGSTLTAYGFAIGVTTGEPVCGTPAASARLSLTIVLTLFFKASRC
jgi:hypothetical protein